MKDLKLGVGRSVITPEVGCHLCGYRPDILSESVADDLTATALYFRQGERQVLLVSLTQAGVELREEALPVPEEKTVCGDLTGKEAQQLAWLLNKILNGAEAE